VSKGPGLSSVMDHPAISHGPDHHCGPPGNLRVIQRVHAWCLSSSCELSMHRFARMVRLVTRICRVFVLPTLLLTSTALQAQNPAPPSPRALLIAADREASAAVLRNGLAEGLEDLFADSVALLYEGAPVIIGSETAHEFLHAQPALSQLRIQWLSIVVAVSNDGTLGMTSGPLVIGRVGQPADSVLKYGHYISVWRRSGLGQWKMAAFLANGLADPDSVVLSGALTSQRAMPVAGGPFSAADIAFAKLAADSGAPIAFGTYAAMDATTPPGTGMVTVGAPAIQARMQAIGAGNSVWAWHPVYAGAAASGDLGFTVGESMIAESRAPNAETSHGKYLTIWRRQADGSIRYILDSGNPRPAR
jgi:ketosteroid isomerase-like protein